jgi:hypothetical protein
MTARQSNATHKRPAFPVSRPHCALPDAWSFVHTARALRVEGAASSQIKKKKKKKWAAKLVPQVVAPNKCRGISSSPSFSHPV